MPIRSLRNIYAFGQTIFVVCPNCSSNAFLEQRVGADQSGVVLDCSACKLTQQWQEAEIRLESPWKWSGLSAMPMLPGFEGSEVRVWVETSPDSTQQSQGLSLPLWLQMPCAGENLWFLNAKHLNFVENYLVNPASAEGKRQQIQWIETWIREADKTHVLRCLEELRNDKLAHR